MKTVLITGTTSGIGRAFAHLFAQKNYHVILTGRDLEKLKLQQKELQTDTNTIDIVCQDMQLPGAADYIYEAITSHCWSPDILINNAGYNEAGYFTKTDPDREMGMIDLHIAFLTRMMKLFIPDMIKKGNGQILNIGSTGSYIACPGDAVYAATKAYVLHLSKAAGSELDGTGVSVTALCPGSTDTAFAAKARLENTLLFKWFVMTPEQVALTGYRALQKRKSVAIPGLYNNLLVCSSAILPSRLTAWMTKKMMA